MTNVTPISKIEKLKQIGDEKGRHSEEYRALLKEVVAEINRSEPMIKVDSL